MDQFSSEGDRFGAGAVPIGKTAVVVGAGIAGLTAAGALADWFEQVVVLDRDPRQWGVWGRFGVQLRLAAGRHRVLARLSEPRTLLRAMHADGTPLVARASTEASAPYTLAAPEVLADPNDLMRFIGPEGARVELDDATRFLVEGRVVLGLGSDQPEQIVPRIAHTYASRHSVYQLTNVANLNSIPESGSLIVVAPDLAPGSVENAAHLTAMTE